MARKYSTLPDLDSAPDVYETPTANATANRTASSSPTSSVYQDLSDPEDPNDEASRIDHHGIHPDTARESFQPSRVDARDVDFSDRLDGHRSYRVRRRRKRDRYGKSGEEIEYVNGNVSDDEEESYDEKVARLKREVEEVRAEGERRKGRGGNGPEGSSDTQNAGLDELSEVLSALKTRQSESQASTLSKPPPLPSDSTAPPALPSPSESTRQTLARATALESRLATLESTIGLHSDLASPPTSKSSSSATQPIMQSLITLERQMSILSTTTAPTLTSLATQISQLTESAHRLEEARKAARQAQDALASKSSRPVSRIGAGGSAPPSRDQAAAVPSMMEDPETLAKIDALYAMLPTIESLAPLLPAVVERLRSLRMLHAEAGDAAQRLKDVERRQGMLGQEIAKWQDGLGRVESAIEKGQAVRSGNRQEVENWVRELEGRMDRLG
ncbi:MAG: hypothetical protein M1828_003100 [Chrysothrix sp. TS-e1954]|nr:MAG: hypothetical protein M1828_003100 [Chrysothrix sp. TS-e1954]